jgi:phosphoglucosamine mutase
MKKKYFGTDGIRGTANIFPMTSDMALKIAMATARVLTHSHHPSSTKRVVIGKDTRRSCYMLETAMASGFLAMGFDVVLTGPVPTPAIANLTRSLRADIGVMISASHNPYTDNGIKIFAADGFKLPDDIEEQIERWIDDKNLMEHLPPPEKMGMANRLDDALGRYMEQVKASFPRGQNLSGLKIVVDCANGAAYKAAPQILWELEAEIVTIGVDPNGFNINDGCGATATEHLQKTVLREKADLGIALDGDADRLILVDELGQRIDGDQILCLLAKRFKEKNVLRHNAVVATVMSNLGMERYLKQQGIDLVRTAVGDRYVVEKIREKDYALGGEQSGHIVIADHATTGDGLLAALQVLSVVQEQKEAGKTVSQILRVFEPVPQILKNIPIRQGQAPLKNADICRHIEKMTHDFSDKGRILVRESGTEPLIRIMVEGDDAKEVETIIRQIEILIHDSSDVSSRLVS